MARRGGGSGSFFVVIAGKQRQSRAALAKLVFSKLGRSSHSSSQRILLVFRRLLRGRRLRTRRARGLLSARFSILPTERLTLSVGALQQWWMLAMLPDNVRELSPLN